MNEDKKQFESGASSSGNVPPYECLTPTFLRRAAERMRLGMHYGKHNWKKGILDTQFILDRLNHALEHLTKAQREIDNGIPMSDDDLAAVVVNCMFAMEYQELLNSAVNGAQTTSDQPSNQQPGAGLGGMLGASGGQNYRGEDTITTKEEQQKMECHVIEMAERMTPQTLERCYSYLIELLKARERTIGPVRKSADPYRR